MKRIRLTQREKEIFKEVGHHVLTAVAIGAIIAVGLTMPKLLILLKPYAKKSGYEPTEQDVEKVFEKLKKDHHVQYVTKNNKDYIQITLKGRRQLLDYDIDTVSIKKQEFNGDWHLVAFDIPEPDRIARDVLREKLKEIGFIKLQKSLWICPYECKKEILFIASVYGVEKYINYIVCSDIDNSQALKKRFGIV